MNRGVAVDDRGAADWLRACGIDVIVKAAEELVGACLTCARLRGKTLLPDAVANVRRVRRMERLDRCEARVLNAVEQPLAAAQQNRNDGERQLIQDSRRERLARRRRAAGNGDVLLAGRGPCLFERGAESLRHEEERGSSVHLDRFMRVVGEDEHRRVIGRLITPPAPPVLVPRAANRTEHVSAHDNRTAWPQQVVAPATVCFVEGVAPMPFVERQAADAERIVSILIRSGDEAVEGNG
jgi:hypothetical protein